MRCIPDKHARVHKPNHQRDQLLRVQYPHRLENMAWLHSKQQNTKEARQSLSEYVGVNAAFRAASKAGKHQIVNCQVLQVGFFPRVSAVMKTYTSPEDCAAGGFFPVRKAASQVSSNAPQFLPINCNLNLLLRVPRVSQVSICNVPSVGVATPIFQKLPLMSAVNGKTMDQQTRLEERTDTSYRATPKQNSRLREVYTDSVKRPSAYHMIRWYCQVTKNNPSCVQ